MHKKADERPRLYLTEQHMDRFVRRAIARLQFLLPAIWLSDAKLPIIDGESLLMLDVCERI